MGQGTENPVSTMTLIVGAADDPQVSRVRSSWYAADPNGRRIARTPRDVAAAYAGNHDVAMVVSPNLLELRKKTLADRWPALLVEVLDVAA